MSLKEAILNLDAMSQELCKGANKKENLDTEWGYYLEQMSWSLHKHANELREMESMFTVFSIENAV